MITTSLDILYISLAIGFLLLVIFTCVAIIQLVFILRDINKVTSKAEQTVNIVHEYIIKPVKLVNRFSDSLKPVVEAVEERIIEHMKKRKKK